MLYNPTSSDYNDRPQDWAHPTSKLHLQAILKDYRWQSGSLIQSAFEQLIFGCNIYHEKWHLSKRVGQDIGVPRTVAAMMITAGAKQELFSFLGYLPVYGENSNRLRGWTLDNTGQEGVMNAYNVIMLGYLAGTEDFEHPSRYAHMPDGDGRLPDLDGKSHLEGELRRFWSRCSSFTGQGDFAAKADEIIWEYVLRNKLTLPASELFKKQLARWSS